MMILNFYPFLSFPSDEDIPMKDADIQVKNKINDGMEVDLL